MKYTYSAIRFVPDPIKGEFVNIAIVVGSDETGDWRIETIRNPARARKLDDESKSLPMVIAELERVSARIEASAESDGETEFDVSSRWLFEMSQQSRGILQYSSPRTVVADGVDDAVGILWPRLVVDSEVTKRDALTKPKLMARFRSALRGRTVSRDHMKERVRLEASESRAEVDFAFHNGVVKQLTQCWSFQHQDTEKVLTDIKSWAWTISRLRQRGGQVVASDRSYAVPRDVTLQVLYAKPTDSGSEGAMNEALQAFRDEAVDAKVHEAAQIDTVADSAEAALTH